MNYGSIFTTRATPQTQPIPGAGQVVNDAGGYSFPVDDWKRLDRFLILGSEGGTYYVAEREFTRDNMQAVLRCIEQDGARVLNRVVEISDQGRAPKNDPALFVLAALCKPPGLALLISNRDQLREKLKAKGASPKEDSEYQKLNQQISAVQSLQAAAYAALPKVARTSTHLFHWVEFLKAFGGRGMGFIRAVRRWYKEKGARGTALQLIKYQSRDGWSHRDLLRLARPSPDSAEMNAAYRWAVKGAEKDPQPVGDVPEDVRLIWAYEEMKRAKDLPTVLKLIREYRLPHECVLNEWKDKPEVWEALLDGMGTTALIRNLGKMSQVQLLTPFSASTAKVISRLKNLDELKRGRIHPLQMLLALTVYQQGHGEKGKLSWVPVSQIVDALNDGFYLSFGTVQPTGKRLLLALDVSPSMEGSKIAGTSLSCRAASAAMALITANVESQYHFAAFAGGLQGLSISPKERLDDVVRFISSLHWSSTDCALPMLYATKFKLPIDAFVVYTDSDTFAGSIHPVEALRDFRQKMGLPAKMIVVGMTSNKFSIADPRDGGSMDVVGFDTGTPEVMSSFIRGEL